MRTSSEEDYLKAIYALSNTNTGASTNALANHLNMKASSITDMLKKLSDKGWVNYEKYKGATLNFLIQSLKKLDGNTKTNAKEGNTVKGNSTNSRNAKPNVNQHLKIK